MPFRNYIDSGPPGPGDRVRRTVQQVVVACVGLIAFMEALGAAGVDFPQGDVLVAIAGAVMVAVTAVQNYNEPR